MAVKAKEVAVAKVQQKKRALVQMAALYEVPEEIATIFFMAGFGEAAKLAGTTEAFDITADPEVDKSVK